MNLSLFVDLVEVSELPDLAVGGCVTSFVSRQSASSHCFHFVPRTADNAADAARTRCRLLPDLHKGRREKKRVLRVSHRSAIVSVERGASQ